MAPFDQKCLIFMIIFFYNVDFLLSTEDLDHMKTCEAYVAESGNVV